MTAYDYTRAWFNFSFDNPDKVSPGHTALFCWLVELNNRMGWAKTFASPTSQSMSACGIKSYNTHKKLFEDLVEFGFIKVIEPSKNQWQCAIIALSKIDKALDKAPTKALDKALANLVTDHLQYNKTTNNKQQTDTNVSRPTLEEVKKYFQEKGYRDDVAEKAWESYEVADWHDSQGKKIKNWKQKMIQVWFQDNHKIRAQPIEEILTEAQRKAIKAARAV